MPEPSDAEINALIAANPGGMTAEQIADVMGFTRQRAFQLIDGAVAKIKRKLAARAIYSVGDITPESYGSPTWKAD